MEGLSVSKNLYSGLKGYWRRKRKGYERLSGAGRRRKNRVEYLSTEKKRRFWKINLRPRLKLNLKLKRFSLKKLLVNMRDAYVNMMLKIANSRVMSSGGFGGLTGDYGVSGFGMRQFKEYDEKMIVEIYRSMVIAQGQLVNRDASAAAATKFGTEIMCQP
ncbi:PREDICTED: uncharacterized protein LOC109217121 [Nicotiana attenuata]|uniref:Uncharacterized protein n=1 Tax=Nicotiana attenuata TaxID=49451 RepID=A0A1J6KJ19_NICAT|nr:PREDICTED: uncharacterized protein LOC109217121 [Nicotiana attenuata]OIT22787.1 hypothetical protein A4A49_30520 [Nicotiana attenuata]